jgi:hypothetical protein
MPFDSDFPSAPADPSQWWRARALPHILVQPNAPANAGSTNPAGSDGIDDWFVPTPAPEQDGFPDDWFVPASAGAVASPPGAPSNPNNANVPAPAAAPNLPAPNPQPSGATAGPSNQPAPPRPDPLAPYWALIPASRVGAMAWHPPIFLSPNPLSPQNIPASGWVTPPPIFLNSPGQRPSAGPAPLDYSLPAYGLLGGIARLAASVPSDLGPPSAANGMLGGIARMIAASAAPDPLSLSGPRGFLGSLADLPVPPSTQAASYAPYLGPFLSSDLIGFPDGGPLPAIELIADKTKGPRNIDLFDERAFGETPPPGSAAPRLVPPFGAGPRPPAPPPLAPPTPPSSPSEVTTISPGQGANGPRAHGTSIGPAPQPAEAGAVPSGLPDGDVLPPLSSQSWRRFEQKHGSRQTTLRTTFRGKDVTVRLDFSPNQNGIVDLKEYNWWKPGYTVPFLQGKVTEKFQEQIQKYQTLDPKVRFQFSEQPPPWVVQAIEQVGGAYFVKPDP